WVKKYYQELTVGHWANERNASILRRLPYPASELNHEDFYSRSSERPSRHGSGSALSATGNRPGFSPDPPSL
ncbi:hypothetical protein VSR51_22350, partial [Escherichia coli]|uniref:hypothetical protein n=1 Tax=Escherichia coli TaxID=562 RepID=UPI002DB9BBC9